MKLTKQNNQNKKIWYLFLLVSICEFVLFKYCSEKNIIKFYPTGFDQTVFLYLSYQLYENIKQFGVIVGMHNMLTLPTGVFFPIQATLFYLLLGVSRFNALLPNYCYFIALQFFALVSIRTFSKYSYISIILLGLILSVHTPFLDSGGILDFRMDFIAFCLYGIFVSLALKSQLFINRKWSIISALIVCLSILLRFITAVYFVGLIGFMLLFLAYEYKFKVVNIEKQVLKKRIINLILISILLFFILIPDVWFNKNSLFNYYIGNHFISNEKYVRLAEVGIKDRISELFFYPLSLLLNHIGIPALLFGVIFLIFSYLHRRDFSNKISFYNEAWVFLLASVFIPLIILTLDKSKSPVVANITVMSVLWLFIWGLIPINFTMKSSRYFIWMMTYLILLFGIYNQIHELHRFPSKTKLINMSAINQMYQDIGDYAEKQHWTSIVMSVDQVVDYLIPLSIASMYYENNGKLLNIYHAYEGMGWSIFPVDKQHAITGLKQSNIIIFNLNDYPKGSAYPFNQTVVTLKPSVYGVVNHLFKKLQDYYFLNSTYRVYVRA